MSANTNPNSNIGGKTPGQPPPQSNGQSTGQPPKQTPGQIPKQTSGQTPVQASKQPTGQTPGGQTSKCKDEDQKKDKPKDVPKLPQYDIDLLKKKGITIGNELNRGSFSIVCKAEMKGKKVAAKIIDLEKTSDAYRTKFLPRELYTMTKLKHPNIVEVLRIYNLQDLRIYVFMELADGGDILDLVKNGALPESKAKGLYKGIADALRFIHENGFAHRDIKCENMLLNRERTLAKISDFGFSRTCFDNSTGERLLSNTFCGSAAYAAPEVLNVKPYNPMISDCWSMGVVLYVMLNCSFPFKGQNYKEIIRLQTTKTLRFAENLSDLCKDLIGHHLEPDIQKRYTMKQVLSHKWFQSTN